MDSSGHEVVPCIHEALCRWSETSGQNVVYVKKGMNMLTENYSAIQAEVPFPGEDSFADSDLLQRLQDTEKVYPRILFVQCSTLSITHLLSTALGSNLWPG
jgi:hypothetical protein